MYRSMSLLCASLLFLAALVVPVNAAESGAYEATTVIEPGVPLEILKLQLKPLTTDQLEAEAEAWLELLQAKVAQLSAAEIAVKRQNQTMATVTAQEEAAEEAEEAQRLAEDARTEEEAQKAAEKAQAAQEEAEAKRQEAEEAKAAAEVAEQTLQASGDAPDEASEETPVAEVEEENEDIAKAKQAKAVTLGRLNELRDERTALVDRLNLVLAALERKGGEVEHYEKYIAAVTDLNLDLTDTEAFWTQVVGWLKSDEGGLRLARNVAKFLGLIVAFWFLARVVGAIVGKAVNRTRNLTRLMREFIATTVRRVIFAIGLVVALSALEVDIGPLLAMIGAAGFVIAFALQDSLGNFASGIMLLVYKPFDEGDVVEVAGISGKVASLNLVSATIDTFDNRRIVVPNNKIWGDVITNVTGRTQRRVDMVFGIAYDDDVDAAQALLERLVKEHPLVLPEPEPTIKLHELGDSSVNFIVRPWSRTEDYWTVYWDLMRTVKKAFDESGISIPFPQRDVHLYKHEDKPRGDAE